jgi:DNA-binding CsgD family transcriptional regulator
MAEPKEPLTERELEVVRLLATGVSNKELAAQIHVSPNTVRVHLRNIFTKLEAQSRTEVTMIAVRNGWVDTGVAGVERVDSVDNVDNVDSDADVERVDGVRQTTKSATPRSVPVPVAPNPLAVPPLPMWRRIVLMAAVVLGVALSILMLQRPTTEATAFPGEASFDPNNAPALSGFSPAESTKWFARASVRTARARAAVTTVGGRVYLIGGEVNRQPSNEVLIYDPRLDDWQIGPAKPTAIVNAGAAVVTNTIFVPGGTVADGQPTNKFEVLNVFSGTWRSLPTLPAAVAGHAVVASNNRVYVLGGRTASGVSNQVVMFDIATNRWAALPPMPTARTLLSAAVLGNRIYAVGGFDGGRELTTCEVYDIATQRWATCAPMTIPRGALGLAQVGSTIYAIGGGLTGYIGFNERYDPIANKWTPFELPAGRLGDWRNVAIASQPTAFYAIGGSSGGKLMADTFVYEVMSNRTFLPSLETGGEK